MKKSSIKRNIILTTIVLSIIFISTAVTVILLFSSQRRSMQKNSLTLTADEVVSRVAKKMNYNNLTPISKQNISRYYEIPENTITDCAMYISGRSGTETELACFKLKDEEASAPMAAAVSSYLGGKTPTDPGVSAAQPTSSVAVHYPYMLVVVAPDCETAAKYFETILDDSLKESSVK